MEKRKITDAIVIHCSATPEGRAHDVKDIRAWHLARGFADVGYHYVIRLDGVVEPGRREDLVGAHCVESGMNRRSIGICYIGGMDIGMKKVKDTRTPEQRRAILELVRNLQRKYGIPDSRVFGHRDFARKGCPSFDVKTMFAFVIMAVMIIGASCSRKVYVPVERTEFSRDTVFAVRNSVTREVDRDTLRISEVRDTIRSESIRWRWRERIVHDTLRETARDSVAVGMPVAMPDSKRGDGEYPGAVKFLICTGVAAILTLLWRISKKILP